MNTIIIKYIAIIFGFSSSVSILLSINKFILLSDSLPLFIACIIILLIWTLYQPILFIQIRNRIHYYLGQLPINNIIKEKFKRYDVYTYLIFLSTIGCLFYFQSNFATIVN
ncbi:hypothetical protein NOVO_00690 [Rickettsiales bacterium Ac37b]|nr:hypothetical protein NOVO_00690 [Rickettsiales bacterium Ac37b]